MRAIRVREYGLAQSAPVVVLHGGPGAPGSVQGLARDLGRSRRALEPLQRRADAAEGAPLDVARHVEDLAAVAPRRCPLVGWSWGAMLGLSYAAAFPERVSALVLVGCGTYSSASREVYRTRMDEAFGAEGRARAADLRSAIEACTSASERDALLAELGALASRAQAHDPLPDSAAPEPLPFDAVGHRATWQDVLRLQEEGVEPARFASITAPVVMLHGAQDPHPGREVYEDLRPHVKRLEYVEFENCGHAPWGERRARTAFFEALEAALG